MNKYYEYIKEYSKALGVALKKFDVAALIKFMEEWCPKDQATQFKMQPLEVQMLTMCKMINARTDMPNELKDMATKWCEEHNFKPIIDWSKEDERKIRK